MEGLLIGETDKNGGKGIIIKTPEGKIKAGGGEIVINEEASKEHCETLSGINESTGGVKIPCDLINNANLTKKNNMKDGGIIYPKERLQIGEYEDSDAVTELELFIDNDYGLYNQRQRPIQKNLITKIAQEKFDINLAPKIYKYLIEDGIKKYTKEFGGINLSKSDKDNLAKNYVNNFINNASSGEYDNYLPKKYTSENMYLGGKINLNSENMYYLKKNNVIRDTYNNVYKIIGYTKEGLNVRQETIAEDPNIKPFVLSWGINKDGSISNEGFFPNMQTGRFKIDDCVYENERDKALLINEMSCLLGQIQKEHYVVKSISKSMKHKKYKNSTKETIAGLEAMNGGGKIKNQYEDKTLQDVWAAWNQEQKWHFLGDHELPLTNEKLVFNDLPPEVKSKLKVHISKKQYDGGGRFKKKKHKKRK